MKKIITAILVCNLAYSYAQITLTKDLSFGNNGIVQITTPNQFLMVEDRDIDKKSMFQGDKIFVSYPYGDPLNGIPTSTRYIKLNYNGTTDNTFGNNGEISVPELESYYFHSQNDFFYLLSGNKFLSNGQIDSSFGNNGMLTTGNWYYKFVLPDGKIISRNDAEVQRFLSNGNADSSFGTNGVVNLNSSVHNSYYNFGHLFFCKDNAVYENVTSVGEVSKMRKINLNTGNLDLSYGENGYAQIRYSNSSNFNFYSGSVVVDDQNNIFVNKFDDLEGNCQLTKTNSLGNLDSAFGTNGVIEFDNSFTDNGEDYLGGERRPLQYENMILVSSEFETAGVGKIGIRGFYTSGNPVMINNDYFFPLSDVTYTHPEYLRMIVKDNYLYVFFDNKISRYIFAQSTLATNAISQNGNSLNLNNPFKDELNLNTNEKIKSVEIYEETGRSVLKANATKNINTSMLKKGIYFIKIITDQNQIISKKGIKN